MSTTMPDQIEVADAQEEEKWRLQEAHRAARDEMSRQLEESYEHKLVDRDKELSALKGKLFSAEEFIGQNVLNLERVTNRLYSGKKRKSVPFIPLLSLRLNRTIQYP